MLFPCGGHPRFFAPRRDLLLRGAGLAVAGMGLPKALLPRAGAAGSGAPREKGAVAAPAARSCILVYLLGGPPHQDMFDLKPAAPAEIRGPFRPIATSVPGIEICEHLPRLARLAGQYALVRSVSQANSNHTPMIYYTLTGRHTLRPEQDNDVRPPQPDDFPHTGAVLARFKSSPADLPGFVALPELAVRSSTGGEFKRARTPLRGGGSGLLGPRYAPLAVNDPPEGAAAVPALVLPPEISAERFQRRAALLALLDRAPRGESQRFDELRKQALELTGSASRGRRVFSLDGESPRDRQRYGRHRFGQSLLLARRLAEAGVPMVAIHFNEMTVCDGWDTHRDNFTACQNELLPMLDQSLSALLEDLQARGRLDETLVVCLGEFGRTPKINKDAGRDHWGPCSAALLAGGGIRGGQVVGASDKQAAYPVSRPVDPADVQATIYHALGLDPHETIRDALGRPFAISTGSVISELF